MRWGPRQDPAWAGHLHVPPAGSRPLSFASEQRSSWHFTTLGKCGGHITPIMFLDSGSEKKSVKQFVEIFKKPLNICSVSDFLFSRHVLVLRFSNYLLR